jgi:hypothetical protein
LKPWPFVNEPSQFATKLKRRFASASMAMVCSSRRPWPWLQLNARFYQAEPAPVAGTTKCPVPLCPTSALPPSGRREPPPARTLLPGLRSYGHIRQSHVALLSFGSSPRSRSLCRLRPAPAATGTFPTLSLRILPQMPEPMPRRFAECVCLVLPQHSSAFPIIRLGRLPASFREHDFPRVGFRGCSYFVMFRPPSLLASQIVPTAASSPAGQPRLLHPSRTCVVTSARIGHAIRPTTGNWRNENFHLARFAALSAAPE